MRTKPHEILGVAHDATLEEARAAYKRLAQQCHPDREGGDSEKFRAAYRAFNQFRNAIPCPVCNQTGFITVRRGLAAEKQKCPQCWKETT